MPPPISLLTHRDLVISQGLARIAHFTVGLSANSLIYSPSSVTDFSGDYANAGSPKINELLTLVGSQKLVYQLARPKNDLVFLCVYFYDKDWHALFGGVTSFQLVSDGVGGWKVPAGANAVLFEPMDVQYSIPNATSARFVERDVNGNVVSSYFINVWNGQVSFPSYLLDKHGEFYVYTYDPNTGKNSTLVYDADSGNIINSTGGSTFASGSFDGIQKVTPVGNAINAPDIYSYKGAGYTPVLEVTVTTAGTYNVYQKTTEGELPDTVIVWHVSDVDEFEYDRTAPATYTPVQLKAGVNHIRFDWPTLQSPNANSGGGASVGTGKGG